MGARNNKILFHQRSGQEAALIILYSLPKSVFEKKIESEKTASKEVFLEKKKYNVAVPLHIIMQVKNRRQN